MHPPERTPPSKTTYRLKGIYPRALLLSLASVMSMASAFAQVPAAPAVAGAPAPAAALTAMPQIEGKTIEGAPFKLSSLKGKVVLVMFWSTGCAVCRDKMPELRNN
jgi:thiol-disulfide isomerase/thioredoxin